MHVWLGIWAEQNSQIGTSSNRHGLHPVIEIEGQHCELALLCDCQAQGMIVCLIAEAVFRSIVIQSYMSIDSRRK